MRLGTGKVGESVVAVVAYRHDELIDAPSSRHVPNIAHHEIFAPRIDTSEKTKQESLRAGRPCPPACY